MPKRRTFSLPGGVDADRIDALLGARSQPHLEPEAPETHKPEGANRPAGDEDWVVIERRIQPDIAARLRRLIGEVIMHYSSSRASAWRLSPPDRMAFPLIVPGKVAEMTKAAPSFADLPPEELEAALRRDLPQTARREASITPHRLTVGTNHISGLVAIRMPINPGAALAIERANAVNTLTQITGVPISRGSSFVPLGTTLASESNLPSRAEITSEASQILAGMGDLPVEAVSVFYPAEDIHRPLYQ